ncbi:hypothetical protein K440DRAFT_364506 [Wilcoxina mikolae CBS 423.85]|nr:hypothetical protein K440DRAFT_364506 [Wilcoxina mikolae CBS 423.85]
MKLTENFMFYLDLNWTIGLKAEKRVWTRCCGRTSGQQEQVFMLDVMRRLPAESHFVNRDLVHLGRGTGRPESTPSAGEKVVSRSRSSDALAHLDGDVYREPVAITNSGLTLRSSSVQYRHPKSRVDLFLVITVKSPHPKFFRHQFQAHVGTRNLGG